MKRPSIPVALAAILLSTVLLGCSTNRNSNPEAEAPPPPEPSPLDTILEVPNLPQAIAVAKPFMADTRDDYSVGAVMLALWSAQGKSRWEDFQAIPATKYKLVMKDPEEARGKRLCVRGSIVQIQVERTEHGKLYNGVLHTNNYQPISYAAVGSTGDLVEGSRAKLCGVVTGIKSYSNVQGGTTHAVFLVGMFDLPENRWTGGR